MSTQTTAAMLDFFDLPAELRNRIYSLAIEDHTKSPGRLYTSRFPVSPKHAACMKFDEPALLHTSVQVRRETMAMYYGTYALTVSDHNDLALRIRALGPDLANVVPTIKICKYWKLRDWQSEVGGTWVAAIASREIRSTLSKRKLFVTNASIYVLVDDRVEKYWSDGKLRLKMELEDL